jgi:hypothetical protein
MDAFDGLFLTRLNQDYKKITSMADRFRYERDEYQKGKNI